jgi:hypothetical protein
MGFASLKYLDVILVLVLVLLILSHVASTILLFALTSLVVRLWDGVRTSSSIYDDRKETYSTALDRRQAIGRNSQGQDGNLSCIG